MQVTMKIYRYNPDTDTKPHYDTFKLEAEPTDRVLDLLEKIKGYEDGSLTFRRSCAHGVCGSCAMRINGMNRLACKTLIQTLHSKKITIEPLFGLPIMKDMVVDMDPFFENYRSVMPYFVNDDKPPKKERLQSPFYTTKKQSRGTGLGLSIAYGIITDHRGKIEVKSRLGKNSQFILKLPITEN